MKNINDYIFSKSDISTISDLVLKYLNNKAFDKNRKKLIKEIEKIEDACIDEFGSESAVIMNMTLQDFTNIINKSFIKK